DPILGAGLSLSYLSEFPGPPQLDAVYIDMPTKQVVGLKPKAAFLPLFNLGEPVKAGEFVLATDLTAAGLDSSGTPRPEANCIGI
ncbi:MAG: hypothetical protein QGH97_13235, partial [Dehalococcoidia bacterium]|nr:hypothetical protein [Dehalococcoidia bacterium]